MTQPSKSVIRQKPRQLMRGFLAFAGLICAGYLFAQHFLLYRVRENIQRRDLNRSLEQVQILQKYFPFARDRWLLQARIQRLEGDNKGFTQATESGFRTGEDKSGFAAEEILLQAQQGQLEKVEERVLAMLSSAEYDTFEVCDAYVNGLLSVGRTDNAEAVINAWRKDHPQAALPVYRLGRLREYQQNIAESKELYEKSIKLQADFFPAIYALGRLLLDENEPQLAGQYFERCDKVPRPEAALTGYAMAQAKLGETEKAKQTFERVLSSKIIDIRRSYRFFFEPFERFVAASEYGKLLVNDQQYSEALEVLDSAIEFNSRDLTSRYLRSLALRGLGKIAEADAEAKLVSERETALREVNELRNAINRDPTNVDAMLKLADILMSYESERNGLFWLRNALSADSKNPQVHAALSKYYAAHADESYEFAELSRHHQKIYDQLKSVPPN